MESEKFKSRNITWCSTSLHVSKEVFIASSVFLWLGLLLGLLCNSAVIMTILHRWTLRSSTVNILVVSLCVADLLGTTCDIPLIITIQISNYLQFQLPRVICSLQVFVHAFASGVQATGLVAVGFERYHSIARPLEADIKRTLWRMKTGIMSTWAVGLLLGIINLTLVPDTITYDYCTQLRGHDDLTHDALLYLLLPFGLICIVLITSCYVCIIMSVRQHSRAVGSSLQVPPTIRVMTNMQSPDDMSQPHVFTVSNVFLSPATSHLDLKTDPETLCSSPCNHLDPGSYRNKRTLLSKSKMKNTFTTFGPSNIKDSNLMLSVCNSLSLSNRDNLSSNCIDSHKDFQILANETTVSGGTEYQPHQSGNPTLLPDSLQSCQTSDLFVSMKSASTNSCKSVKDSVINAESVSLRKATRKQNSPERLCSNSDANSITTSVSEDISPLSTARGNETNSATSLFNDEATSHRNSTRTRYCELEKEQHSKLTPPLLLERFHSNENSIYQEIFLGTKNNCERGKRKMETQTAKRAGYIIASFVLLWLPQPLTTFLENSAFTDIAYAHNIQMFTVSVATFSAAMNPIVYGLAIKQFRATFITMVMNQWRRWKQRLLW